MASGQRIVILDGLDGQEVYRSVSFAMGSIIALTVADTDGDTTEEVVFAVGNAVYILDPVSGLVEHSHQQADIVTGLAVELSPGPCRLAITFLDRLEQRGCADGNLIGTRPFGIEATFVGIPAGSDGPLVLSDGRRVYRLQDDMITAQSTLLDNRLGDANRGVVVGGDDAIDVYIGGMHGVHRVALPVEEPLFADGFED